MAQAGTAAATTRTTPDNTSLSGEQTDLAESMLRSLDRSTKQATGVSLFHILTIGSIGASIALFFAGKKSAGIFVGLWPPTFQALKAAADTNKNED